MMNLEYFHNILRAENFTRDGDALISMDQRVKIILCPEGGYASYYDGIWWEEAEYEDYDNFVAELTWDVVAEFGHPCY